MLNHNDFRILIIDDNPAIHQDFKKILTSYRYEKNLYHLNKKLFTEDNNFSNDESMPTFVIDCASQGEEGILRVQDALKEGYPYALAFVDIRMPPGLDGVQTIKRIWELDKNIQVIICTAYSDYSWENTIKQLGVNDNLLILKKPFDNATVRQMAASLACKWELAQEVNAQTKLLKKRVKNRTHSLNKSLSLIRATLESSADGIVVVGKDNVILDYNEKFVEMWNIPAGILEAKDAKSMTEYYVLQIKKPDHFLEKLRLLQYRNTTHVATDVLHLENGKVYELYSQPQKLKNKIMGRVWSFRDITQCVALEKKLQFQATHDPLTGCVNRILLAERFKLAASKANRSKDLLAVLFFDLDRFKLINDSLGHYYGDQLLAVMAQRLQNAVRAEDTLARTGGDEYILLVSGIVKVEHLMSLADKLLQLIAEPVTLNEREIMVTASLGISMYPKDETTLDELLRYADLAMYRAKERGSNQLQFFTPSLNQECQRRFEQEAELRAAMKNKDLVLYYQPQFNLVTNKIISVEALIRWRHINKGMIQPLSFIQLAEETGLIIPMGEWVLRTACAQNKAWQDAGFPPVRIAVNVTTRQFRQANFVELVEEILSKTGLEAQYLELELTENVIINNIEIVHRIEELKRLGVKIVLDDFGTGNSSLNYLRTIPVDRLKIDKSFIDKIDVNHSDSVLVQAIISLAHNLKMEVMAEGVETKEQIDFLTMNECKEVQGFYFSKPLMEDEMADFFKKTGGLFKKEK